jgi:hypothetical protein
MRGGDDDREIAIDKEQVHGLPNPAKRSYCAVCCVPQGSRYAAPYDDVGIKSFGGPRLRSLVGITPCQL